MKFLICGYYGFGNAGDELLLAATIGLIRERHNGADICVLSNDPSATAAAHNVCAVWRYNLFGIFRQIFASNRVIIGGGGLLQDFTGPLTLYYYLAVAICSLLLGRQVVFHAVGANELKNLNSRLCAYVLSRCSTVSVRDERSVELLKLWGVPDGKISLSADPVFAGANRENGTAELSCKSHPTVLLVIRAGSNIDNYIAAMPEIAGLTGGKIIVVPFQPQKDGNICAKLAGALPQTISFRAWTSLQGLLKIFDDSVLVVTERYHAMVLAAMIGVPAVCVSDDDKLLRFARVFGYPALRPSDKFDRAALKAVIESVWKLREKLKPVLLRKAQQQAALARANPALQ